jgi:membrane AbrB-like protein
MRPRWDDRYPRLALTLALALASALLCVRLRVPLPWMIGPLLVTAGCGLAGLRLQGSRRLRNGGLWMIGVALGLYFTPPVVAVLWQLAPAIAAGVLWALALGYAFYRWLLHHNGGDRATAFFAATIGGASEMALLAERHQGQVDRVAAAHSLRVLLVVVLIPVAYQLAGIHGADATLPAVQDVRPAGLAVLLATSAAGMALMWRLGTPNPWVLGALLSTLALTASGLELSALPREASNAGQLAIGVALGTRFTPEFARTAPRWLASVAVGTLAMIGVSGVFAGLLALAAGLHPATVLLATSPGGIAEMCITAKVLQLGVPVVTAFHVVRYVAVLTLTEPIYCWEVKRAARGP